MKIKVLLEQDEIEKAINFWLHTVMPLPKCGDIQFQQRIEPNEDNQTLIAIYTIETEDT